MSSSLTFRDIVAKNHTRQHNGNVYNTTNYNTYASVPNEGSSSSRMRHRSSSSDGDPDAQGVRKRLMNSLYYDGFDYRKESLEGPQPQTFEWIFDVAGELVTPKADSCDWRTENQRRLVWSSFPCWLESPDSSSQYCILGKAGSGKSTLMAWISRDQQEQTVSHLRRWAGSRPVDVVTHFLFRPSANALGRNLEGLLRSLFFQVLSLVPDLHNYVFDGHEARNHEVSATRRPVRALKEMLKRAFHSTQQQVFCIFIDGVDEFHDDGHVKDDLKGFIDYLLELQQPEHIKLCLSSRPTTRKLNNLPSISKTTLRLTDLNRLDILTYVSQAMHNCDGLREPHEIVREVCQRADGVFLWAVFAVQETCKWADTEDKIMLLERLERMGTQLEETFAYMLANVEHAHRETLAFYVKTLKWSKMKIIPDPPSVALFVAAQEDISNWSHKKLVERCELEERRVTQWSRGLLEITTSRDDAQAFSGDYTWQPRTSQDIEQRYQQLTDTQELPTDWIIAKLDHHGQGVAFFDRRRISWLHRSAFDFFFSPASPNHSQQTNGLLDSYSDRDVTSAILQGHIRLMLTLPHACANLCSACLVWYFHDRAHEIIQTAASATTLLGECHDDTLDQVLTTLLAWKHYGAHAESFSDYGLAFNWIRSTPGLAGCPFSCDRPFQECIKDKCFVGFDLGRLRRNDMMEQADDTCYATRDALSEAMFWRTCASLGLSSSNMIQRSVMVRELRAGGVILAPILDAMRAYPQYEPSANEIRYDADVRDQTQLLINRHARALDLNASRWMYDTADASDTADYSYEVPTIISWLSLKTRSLSPAQGVCAMATATHRKGDEDDIETWMIAALTSIWVHRPLQNIHRQFDQLLAPWDICVGIGCCGDLAIMMNVAELAKIVNTEPTKRHNNVVSLRLMLGDAENGRMASHSISHDTARRICKHYTETTLPHIDNECISRFGGGGFVAFAEDLLQDVHQNSLIPATEKKALEKALCLQLVQHARFKTLGELIPPCYS